MVRVTDDVYPKLPGGLSFRGQTVRLAGNAINLPTRCTDFRNNTALLIAS